MEFKVGNKIRMKVSCSGCDAGEVYTLVDHEGTLKAKCNTGKNSDGCTCEGNWILVSGKKSGPVMYLVQYDRVDRDPMETFGSKKELMEWLEDAFGDKSILWKSIRIFEIKQEFKPSAISLTIKPV